MQLKQLSVGHGKRLRKPRQIVVFRASWCAQATDVVFSRENTPHFRKDLEEHGPVSILQKFREFAVVSDYPDILYHAIYLGSPNDNFYVPILEVDND